jgi:hypothetical protein
MTPSITIFSITTFSITALSITTFSMVTLNIMVLNTKYLRYLCEAKDLGHKRGDTVQNFVKTKSFRPRKTSWNTMNFR